MDPLIVAAAVFAFAGVFGLAILILRNKDRRQARQSPIGSATASAGTMELRRMWLKGMPREINIEPMGEVLGVLFDMSMSNGSASLAMTADGSTSLYFSGGGGIIGAGGHERVQMASSRLLRSVSERLELFEPAINHELPARGYFRFFVMTKGELLFADADQESTTAGTNKMSGLFRLADDVLTEVRLVDEAMQSSR